MGIDMEGDTSQAFWFNNIAASILWNAATEMVIQFYLDLLSISNSGRSCNVTVKIKKMAADRNVLNFNVKCFQDNGSFLHPTQKADAHQLSKTKKKKKQLKLAWKKNRKTDGKRMQKKKKNE